MYTSRLTLVPMLTVAPTCDIALQASHHILSEFVTPVYTRTYIQLVFVVRPHPYVLTQTPFTPYPLFPLSLPPPSPHLQFWDWVKRDRSAVPRAWPRLF